MKYKITIEFEEGTTPGDVAEYAKYLLQTAFESAVSVSVTGETDLADTNGNETTPTEPI